MAIQTDRINRVIVTHIVKSKRFIVSPLRDGRRVLDMQWSQSTAPTNDELQDLYGPNVQITRIDLPITDI
jgi:hypothetical protein